MSYAIQRTELFFIKKTILKEYDAIITAYSKDFGIIQIIAYGFMRPTSKLKHSLDSLSLIEVELVHGKEFWILVGARIIKKVLSIDRLFMWDSFMNLLQKYSGEKDEHSEEIFTTLITLFEYHQNNNKQEHLSKNLILYWIMYLLYIQGFWPHTLRTLIFESTLDQAIMYINKERNNIERDINEVIKRIV